MGVFDYAAPDDFRDKIKAGQLVTIPFRKSIIFGLIQSVNQSLLTATYSLLSIDSIVHIEPLVSKEYLKFLEIMSARHGVSIGAMAKLALPPLQKKKLKNIKLTAQSLKLKDENLKQMVLHFYRTPAKHSSALAKAIRGATLILVPQKHLISEILSLIPSGCRKTAIVWHGELTEKERFAAWLKVRCKKSDAKCVIGTRSAAFLPFQRLDTIIIDHEHDENHKNWDSQPRYDARDVAEILAGAHGATLHRMSFSPGFDSYTAIYDGAMRVSGLRQPNTDKNLLFPKTKEGLPTVCDMREERRSKNFGLFADAALSALQTSRGDMVFLVNRLGFAAVVGCGDCGYRSLCHACREPMAAHAAGKELRCHACGRTEATPLSCPACGSTLVRLRGAGTETVETEVRRQLGDAKTHEIARIDSATNGRWRRAEGRIPIIIIGTDMALPHIRWDNTELVVFLDMDHRLAIPEYRARENAWHLVQEIQYRRRPDSKFLIQTFQTEHAIFKSFAEPDRFYRTELSGRKALGYPPYRFFARYLVPGRTTEEAQKSARRLHDELQALLTTACSGAILRPPIETQPESARGRYWQTLTVSLPKTGWQNALARLNEQHIPDDAIVDPNPLSLCSP